MSDVLKTKKIALVHDYLLGVGGAERVLKVLHEMFPYAPIYVVVYDKKFTDSFLGKDAVVYGTFLQKLPGFLRRHYKFFSFLIPSAIEQLDLSQFDIVISSCSAFCKGVITRPDTIHICYCHTPTRFLWDWAVPYTAQLNKMGFMGSLSKILLHFLRLWDRQAANRVDAYIANSQYIARRIKKYYGRESKVLYPPVPDLTSSIALEQHPVGYFLIVSQLRSYKRIDLAIETFAKIKLPLVIIGQGSDSKRIKKLARGFSNIEIIGPKTDEEVAWYYKNCKAFVFPGDEDFGMVMAEVMFFGKPVLAYRAGGAQEIIEEGITGEFFDSQHPLVMADGIRRLLANYASYNSSIIRQKAKAFSYERFKSDMLDFVRKQVMIDK